MQALRGSRDIICKSVNFCWFFFKWSAILAIVVLVAAAPFCYRQVFFRMEEELRVRVEATLAKRIPHLDVRIQAAHLAADGIEVRGLSISEPGADGPQRELAHFDVLFLECQTSPKELLSGEPLVTGLKISRPVFRATRRPDGSYSLSKLFPLPKPVGPPPRLSIEGGTIEVFDPLKNPSSTLVLRDLNLVSKPVAGGTGEWPTFEFEGYVIADHVRRIEWTGKLDPNTKQWSAAGTVDDLDISPELRGSLPAPIAAQLEVLAGFRAPATLSFTASSNGDAPPQFVIDGSVSRGRIEDSRLPYPLTDVRGDFHFDNKGFRISELTARDGPTLWKVIEFQQWGYAVKSPFVLKGGGSQVHLDNKWAAAIPDKWRKYWHYYEPVGDVNLAGVLEFDGTNYSPSVDVRSLDNVSFSFHKFPYRLDRARGTLSWRNNVLNLAMIAFAGPQPVTLSGNFSNPGPQFTGSIEITADKIPLDDKLFEAVLKPKSHETLVSLNPRGSFDLYARIWRDDPSIREMQQYAQVTLDASNRCSVAYDKFPYPLENVQGVITMKDGTWSFKNLAGSNGTGVVHLSGNVATAPGAESMRVELEARQIELVEELRNALQPGVQKLWDALQPHGRIDVSAVVEAQGVGTKPSVWIRAYPKDDATSIGTSIEPVAFPYRMRLLGGHIVYQDGHATLHEIHAVNGNTDLRTEGDCDIRPDGAWQLRLRNLTADRVRLQGEDHALTTALPEALRRAIGELKPSGPINIQGAVDFAKVQPNAPLYVGWHVALSMFQGSLNAGAKLENVFGDVELRGSCTGSRFSSQGELHVDSVTYKNFQFTGVNGPLWFDNENVFLGAIGPQGKPTAAGPPRRVVAKLLNGTLAGDCHIRLTPGPGYHGPQYHLNASLNGADLSQFARENLPGNQRLNGKVAAEFQLQGTPGPRNLSGAGTIHLTEADVYDLPVMISLLSIARAKVPDSTAFTKSDIQFEIQQGEHIILKQINLDGDAINLSGNGELTLDGQTNPIRMTLHAAGGRGAMPIVEGLLSEASKQILLIHVGGTLEHPEARTEPFPVANQTLQQFQADPSKPPDKQAGGFMKSLGFR